MNAARTYRRAAGCLPRLAARLRARVFGGRPAPTDDAKSRILAEVDDETRASLDRIDAAFFTVAAEIAEDPSDRASVLTVLCELYERAVQQEKRRGDEAEAKLATLRRHGLRLLVSDPHKTKETP